jgi:hypothetical protein
VHDDTHETADDHRSGDHALSRRAALQIAGAAGAAVAAAPLLARAGPGRELFDLHAAEPALVSRLDWPVPPIVTRAQWGANESLRKPGRSFNSVVRKIIVHHTGTPNSITDYPGLARSIFKSEVNNGYIDIAYNWLIDPLGRIYEGRFAKSYPAGVPHTGESDRKNVQGAHALHFNANTIGIGLMGDYRSTGPTAAMVEALTTLMTWKCARWGIDPLGASPYVTSQGETVTGVRNICGHRDTYATACPGNTVEAMLPALRTRVASRVAVGATGYWVAVNSGQLVAFGNLPNAGSTVGMGTNAPIVGMATRPQGDGYWMTAADGGIFTFGRAPYLGSGASPPRSSPCVAIAASTTGRGYALLLADGSVLPYGDVPSFGGAGGRILGSAVGLAGRFNPLG